MKRSHYGAIIGLCALLVTALNGCTARSGTTPDQSVLSELTTGSVAVMPFLIGRHDSYIDTSVNATIDCPACQLIFNTGDIKDGADKTLTRYVHESLLSRFGERLIPLEIGVESFAQLSKDSTSDTLRSLAVRLGKALNTDYIFAGSVWRYKERAGTAHASTSPASVGFVVYTVKVADGRMLWKAAFHKTQRSLSENIFDARTFMKYGARWLSADEWARYGVDEVFDYRVVQ